MRSTVLQFPFPRTILVTNRWGYPCRHQLTPHNKASFRVITLRTRLDIPMFLDDHPSNTCNRLPQECIVCITAVSTDLQPLQIHIRASGNRTQDLLIIMFHSKRPSILLRKRSRVTQAMHFGNSASHLQPPLLRLRFLLPVNKVVNGLQMLTAITLMNDLRHSQRLIMSANLNPSKINNSSSPLQWQLQPLLFRFKRHIQTMSIAIPAVTGLGQRRQHIAPTNQDNFNISFSFLVRAYYVGANLIEHFNTPLSTSYLFYFWRGRTYVRHLVLDHVQRTLMEVFNLVYPFVGYCGASWGMIYVRASQ